jgi:type IV pilus assembly protein PilY1
MDKCNGSRWARSLLLVGCAALFIFGVANADDTELFVTGFDTPASCSIPNVMFIIDTSASMSTEVETQVSWDPAQSFAGCFDGDALYYSRTGELPDCASIQKFPKAGNFCAAAADDLWFVGRYKNLFRGWDASRERWLTLEELTGAPEPEVLANFPVECETDRGVHGDGTTGVVFASEGTAQPWAATNASEPSWASASNVTLFDGNWLNWNSNPPTVTKSRLDVVKEVTNAVIDSMEQTNVAIMRFNFDEGGPVVQAMDNLEQSRDQAKAVINALKPDGATPLSETLYEAGQYVAGRLVDYGNVGPEFSVAASRLNGDAGSAEYYSPIQTEGQKTYIILLSDGEPNGDSTADDKITGLPGFGNLVGQDCDGIGDGACLDDMICARRCPASRT